MIRYNRVANAQVSALRYWQPRYRAIAIAVLTGPVALATTTLTTASSLLQNARPLPQHRLRV